MWPNADDSSLEFVHDGYKVSRKGSTLDYMDGQFSRGGVFRLLHKVYLPARLRDRSTLGQRGEYSSPVGGDNNDNTFPLNQNTDLY